MASPYWKYPGVLEGRIQPSLSQAQDGSWVYCLGADKLEQFRLQVNDVISVEQDINIATATDLLRFAWHMRVPSDMPAARTIVSAGLVSFKNGGLLHGSDSLHGFIVHAPDSPLTAADAHRVCTVSGATDGANNGTFHIYLVAANQGTIAAGTSVALIENGSIVARDNDPSVTIAMVAYQWAARAYIDIGGGWVEKLELVETPNREVYRNELALHLSQYTGDIKVKFELKLEAA